MDHKRILSFPVDTGGSTGAAPVMASFTLDGKEEMQVHTQTGKGEERAIDRTSSREGGQMGRKGLLLSCLTISVDVVLCQALEFCSTHDGGPRCVASVLRVSPISHLSPTQSIA